MKKVILAGVAIRSDSANFQSRMAETGALCEACGLEIVFVLTQVSNSMDPATAFRKGKLEALRERTAECRADGIIFHNALSVKAANRIAEYCGVEVKDRAALILDIFSLRARTHQAKLQTELARLEYALPQVLSVSEESGHERGGAATNRGAGEMRQALIARKYRARIANLKKEIQKIAVQNDQDERRRSKTMLKRAALVGYTNAGKSSFMNYLLEYTGAAGKAVYTEDMLFATLDTSVRNITYDGRQFLLYDTVGFVSDLPEPLKNAFHTTLASAKDADLLIHIIDASDPEYAEKIQITDETLQAIGAGEIPVLRVFNKCDLVKERPKGIAVSCLNGEGFAECLSKVMNLLYPQEEFLRCLIPYDRISVVSAYQNVVRMEFLEYLESGVLVSISGESVFLNPFRQYEQKG